MRVTVGNRLKGLKEADRICGNVQGGDWIEERLHLFSSKQVFMPSYKLFTFEGHFQLMSKDEIKYEINKVLDGLSNAALQELLSFLKQLEEKNSLYKLDADQLNSILEEDEELLKKLAQ